MYCGEALEGTCDILQTKYLLPLRLFSFTFFALWRLYVTKMSLNLHGILVNTSDNP